jgi:hypothetical protein
VCSTVFVVRFSLADSNAFLRNSFVVVDKSNSKQRVSGTKKIVVVLCIFSFFAFTLSMRIIDLSLIMCSKSMLSEIDSRRGRRKKERKKGSND